MVSADVVWDRSFARAVRDALAHLHDLPYLQRHRLAQALRADPAVRPARVGTALQTRLVDAIAALAPSDARGSDRVHRLFTLRYIEALSIAEVSRQIGVGKTEYHRAHGEGLAALIVWLADRDGSPIAASIGAVAASILAPAPTSFVGRDEDVARLRGLLGSARLITLTGAPGTGKTRLAREVLAGLDSSRFADGVRFIELAPVADPTLVVPTIGRALGLRTPAGEEGLAQLRAWLLQRRLLLVLDNCEHVVSAAADVASLLATCPYLSVLATSRVPLHVYGEQEMPLSPLDDEAAARLFVDRARAVRPTFASDPAVIRELCRRLDRLPLAVELAAARVRLLPPEAMLARLDATIGALDLGTGGPRDLSERQRSLRAAIAWSHDLLTPDERRVFGRLGIFVGGFDLAAASAVAGAGAEAAVEALLHHSLLVQTAATGEPRFGMLEMVREYAREQLRASGEADDAASAHAIWVRRLAADVSLAPWGTLAQATALDRITRDLDNVRAAIRYYEVRGDPARWELASDVSAYWILRGDREEGRRWLRGAPAEFVFGPGRHGGSLLLTTTPHIELAVADAWRLAAEARAAGDLQGEAAALTTIGQARSRIPLEDEMAFWERVVALGRALDDPRRVALGLQRRAERVLREAGDPKLVRALALEARDLFASVANHWGVATASMHLADAALIEADLPEAERRYGDAFAAYRRIDDRTGESVALGGRGETARRLGRLREARALSERALGILRDIHGDDPDAWDVLARAARIALDLGRARQAARIAAAVQAAWGTLHRWPPVHDSAGLQPPVDGENAPAAATPRSPAGDATFAAAGHVPSTVAERLAGIGVAEIITTATAALAPDAVAAAMAAGRAMSTAEAIADALTDHD